MGERKVINNYISPDFDPSIIPKFKRNKDRIQEIRMMLPFSMQCNTCGEYMYRGKKFNSKKEDCKGEDYMGIRRFRFYIKCSVCSAEISFKTDPKNSDYECESGASRNFEVWRDTEEAKEEVIKEREEEDANDTMKALENRTLDSKLEMDVLDALDEIKAINQRHERVDTNAALAALHNKNKNSNNNNTTTLVNGLTAEDEALVKSIKFGVKKTDNNLPDNPSLITSISTSTTASTDGIETNNRDIQTSSVNNSNATSLLQKHLQQQATTTTTSSMKAPVIIVKKRKIDMIDTKSTTTTTSNANSSSSSNSGSSKVETKNQTTSNTTNIATTNTNTTKVIKVDNSSLFGDYGNDSD